MSRIEYGITSEASPDVIEPLGHGSLSRATSEVIDSAATWEGVYLVQRTDNGPWGRVSPAPTTATKTPLPHGYTVGVFSAFADDDNARDAVAALVAAGHTPALLANTTDGDDVDLARGTGFQVDIRGPRVLVSYLIEGADSSTCLPGDERRRILRGFRDTLQAAGWETDPRIIGSRLYAWRAAPLPERVTLTQTRGGARETHTAR
ncbi:hypothetical protein [Streptomyces sp. NPDC088752]|uniref:hypothetical protein n=1 Tax=Streptomyces sp. NPDC088752 TaxID=3154963 RepID=UPI003440A8DE